MLQMVFITLLLALKDLTRLDEAPLATMATMATQMSAPHAVELLKKRNLTRDALSLITDIAKHT